MTPPVLILLVTALLTSIISAVIGMGGGILLLAVMLGCLPHGQAVPIHGLVQLASNSTRIAAYAGHVDWRVVRRFAVGLLPGTVLGGVALWWIGEIGAAEPYLKMAVGTYVLAAPFLPSRASPPHAAARNRDFLWLGLVAGVLCLTVGAVGPLIAPIFARHDFVKERLIATKATCQMCTHLVKVPAFAWLGHLALGEHSLLTGLMILAVIPGTLIGRRLMPYVSADAFRMMYRGALVLAGLKVLLVDGIWALATNTT